VDVDSRCSGVALAAVFRTAASTMQAKGSPLCTIGKHPALCKKFAENLPFLAGILPFLAEGA
jgi:hypothetical protein